MDINRQTMNALFTGYKKNFEQGIQLAPLTWSKFATAVPSTTSIEEYPFLDTLGGMREWLGPRQIKNVASKKLTVTNKTYEDTIGIPRESIEDDTYGIYSTIIAGMGEAAGRLWNELVYAALVANGNWLDGSPFFGTTRKYGANTISNYGTSALSATAFNAAYLLMSEYKSATDKPLNARPNLLICGPKNRAVAFNILQNQFVNDGVAATSVQLQNPNQGLCELMISPDLIGTYDDYWFLVNTSQALKAVILQQRRMPEFIRKDRNDDDNVVMDNQFLYCTSARGAAALTMPHLVHGNYL
jgi:phage major head subunit gpT-like protein